MQRRQLSDEVAAYLRQSIMAGEFAPGASVKAEAVGERLDVSATPVREALHALRAEGFLELVPRRGFTVRPLTAADIRDIFEAHALIAGELAARAAAMIDDAGIARLRENQERLMAAARQGDHALLEQLNDDFHRQVYAASGSERLRWALGGFVKYVPSAFYAEIAGWPDPRQRITPRSSKPSSPTTPKRRAPRWPSTSATPARSWRSTSTGDRGSRDARSIVAEGVYACAPY